MTPASPLLRFHGGKWKLFPWIVDHLPRHRLYVEPFGGAASILVRKPRSESEIYNDLDEEVVNLFRVLRDDKSTLKLSRLIDRTPFSRMDYKAAYKRSKGDSPVERARKLLIRSCMGQSSKGIWITSGFDTRVNDDGFISRINTFAALPDLIAQFAVRMKGVVIENIPAAKLIPQFDRPDCLIYCDPPYLPSSRSGAKVFKHDLNEEGHREIATLLRESRSMVVLSGYPCDLYDKELYPDWYRLSTQHLADGARPRTEVLWLNKAAENGLRQQRLFR